MASSIIFSVLVSIGANIFAMTGLWFITGEDTTVKLFMGGIMLGTAADFYLKLNPLGGM